MADFFVSLARGIVAEKWGLLVFSLAVNFFLCGSSSASGRAASRVTIGYTP